jgi:TatD DNase family protein
MDLHCHIDLYSDYKSVIEKAYNNHLYVLSITTTPKAWIKTNELTKNYPRFNTALGLHPQLAHQRENELSLFDDLFHKTKYIGEIGLDGSKHCKPFMDAQLRVFRHILKKCSMSKDKILSIHSRSAAKEVIAELESFGNVGNVILHWYTGSKNELLKAVDLDCWFSIGPAMLESNNGKKIINWIPKNKILLETDGPFAKYKGKVLEPVDVNLVTCYLSELWSMSTNDVEVILKSNLRYLVSSC